MKSKEEIEQLANDYGKSVGNTDGTTAFDFKLGYTQCQEDMTKELKEWIVVTLSAESKLGASDNVIEALLNVKYKIESLNKQD
jgi:hypothetical protein